MNNILKREYSRLLQEMKDKGVKHRDLETAIGIKRVALSRKLHCQIGARFSLEQAITIHEKLFPDVPIEVLFKR